MRNFNISPLDKDFTSEIQNKIDNLNKPKGALGMLENIALQIGLIQHSLNPCLFKPHHILFGADHGIEKEGVSVSPREITWQQMKNFTVGGGGVNLFCRQHKVHLYIVDVGVDYDFPEEFIDDQLHTNQYVHCPIINRKIDYGTRNFLYEYAITEQQFDRAIDVGVEMTDKCKNKGCNVLSLGEMGIANTSPSSIWMYFFQNIPLDKCVGAGAGLDSKGVEHKFQILKKAVDCFVQHVGIDTSTPFIADPQWTLSDQSMIRPYFPEYAREIIRWFGGFEMVAAVGAMMRAAELGMIIIIDGFIMTACALAAFQLNYHCIDYMIFGHQGDETGHALMLRALGVKPVLNLGMRLGEGTGALCALPVIQSAVNMINEMDNFSHAGITKYF